MLNKMKLIRYIMVLVLCVLIAGCSSPEELYGKDTTTIVVEEEPVGEEITEEITSETTETTEEQTEETTEIVVVKDIYPEADNSVVDRLDFGCSENYECRDKIWCTVEKCEEQECVFLMKDSCFEESQRGYSLGCEQIYAYCKDNCGSTECRRTCWDKYSPCYEEFVEMLIEEKGEVEKYDEDCADKMRKLCKNKCGELYEKACIEDCYIMYCGRDPNDGKETCIEIDDSCKEDCKEHLSSMCYSKCRGRQETCRDFFQIY